MEKRNDPPPRVRRTFLDYVHTKTFTPREYQVELLDSAKERNVIVCMGTGTGKTFIAVMLIQELSVDIRGDYDGEGKRTIFLAPTVNLVRQQKRVLEDHTNLKVEEYYGSLGVAYWNKNEWEAEFKKKEVLVMTPDIFKEVLLHKMIPLSKVNLIVIDECHRAVKHYAYNDIMNMIADCSPDSRPRILGLSASLLNGNIQPDRLEEHIKSLERTLLSSVEGASSLASYNQYISKPKEQLAKFDPAQPFAFLNELHRLLDQAMCFFCDIRFNLDPDLQGLKSPVEQPKRYLIEITYTLVTLGPWCTQKVAAVLMNEISVNLQWGGVTSVHTQMLLVARTVLEQVFQICEQAMLNFSLEERVMEMVPHKLKTLLEILRPYKPDEEEVAKANNALNKEREAVTNCDTNQSTTNTSDLSDKECNKSTLEGQLDFSKASVKATQATGPYINKKFGHFLAGYPKRRAFVSEAMAALDAKALCGIIFVRQRVTAYVLSLWLNEVVKLRPEFNFIRPNFVVGHKLGGVHREMDHQSSHHQEEILRRFRSREYNLLVATSVVEEGLDVPKCNLVIRFDLPDDFRSYIQSKGRARAPDSRFCLMVKNDDNSFLEKYTKYKKIENILMEKWIFDHDPPTEEEIADHVADQILPPYIPVKEKDGGARVTLSTAVALVNRYCCKLPSDTFTRLTPKWTIETIPASDSTDHSYRCTILLPINSPLKEIIIGPNMRSKSLSKMAAALETCKRLHQSGELDDNLLPVGKESVKFEEEVLSTLDIEQVPQGAPRPGTTKRRQYYYKMVADALCSSPNDGIPCRLYNFSMKLTCPIPEEQNTRGRKIHDPSSTTRGFGILTTKPIPSVCSFPVFTRSGEVTIELDPLSSDLEFSKEELEKLITFHRFTFQEVLRLEKYPMLFDFNSYENSFYVIPLNKSADHQISIDWDFVNVISQQKPFSNKRIPVEERLDYQFRTEDYNDAVVMPWYRNLDKPQFFYVAEICSELSPLSDFPDFGYETFKDYYQEKYDIKIVNTTQPLLDVDHTSARLNLLTPRYVNRKGMTLPTSSENTKKAKRENLQQKQILIPELCIVHPFPASLWRKAVCLPCILYRLNSLLLAEELRSRVAASIGVGSVNLEDNFKWSPLDFGWTLAEVLQKSQEQAKRDEEQQKKQAALKAKLKLEAQKSRTNVPNNNTWLKDMKDDGSGDFVIDTFDPDAVHIPDDSELLDDEELAHINFPEALGGTIAGLPLGDWDKVKKSAEDDDDDDDDDDGPEVKVRVGSPSNFEGTGWDSEWDMDIDESNVFRLNHPSLGYISAPSGFNIQGLSHDLATCRYDDIYDSDFDDDEESIYDEMEAEYMGATIKDVTGMDTSNLESSFTDQEKKPTDVQLAQTLEQNESTKKAKQDCKQIDSPTSEWLSACSESYVRNEIAALASLQQDLLSDLDNAQNGDEPEEMQSFTMISEAVKHIERPKELGSEDALFSEGYDSTDDAEVDEIEEPELVSKSKAENSAPAFGELLPERDHNQLKGSADNEIFRTHFDDQPEISAHPGPSPSIILQAFTMSNANDGINLERLETVGDSFLKYAITAYLFCSYPSIHEGKLSYLRSKQISNLNLYRLGKKCGLGQLMIASKFEPNDNWLPPCYTVPRGLEQAFIDSGMPAGHWNIGHLKNLTSMDEDQIRKTIMDEKHQQDELVVPPPDTISTDEDNQSTYIRYNLLTQHSIPDKSIADCVEALIGAYLVSCGPRGALLFMSWIGLRVLPDNVKEKEKEGLIVLDEDREMRNRYGQLKPPMSPLLHNVPDPHLCLKRLLSGFEAFETKVGYTFQDKSYLLQAFTHASYHYNRITDCYQRLEFLGDAILDYLITRHLYEDPQQHYPGVLTDLRSALVNNTFFASLAVKYDFHKYFKAISPGLFGVVSRFVDLKRNKPGIVHFEEYYLEEEECEVAEEVEVPKALGDIFESVAGAIYLDSGMSLDTVWRVYYRMMKPEIEYFSSHVPKSPIRELLETYPQTARFDRAEMTMTGKVRIRVEVVGKGTFVGVGRNKRIAKCTAAKRALRALRKTHIQDTTD